MKNEMDFEKELKNGQKIAAEVVALAGGIGAGGIVGGLLMCVADSRPCGKFVKLVYRVGSIGVGWYVDRVVEDEMDTRVKELFVAYNRIKQFAKNHVKVTKVKEEPADAEEAAI